MISIGGFGGSANDAGISETFFPEQGLVIERGHPAASHTNPPPSPPILINPHEHRIIDTKHRDLVRVSIFGTSGFPVKDINPATVELDGVHAVAHITRKVKRDEFPFATYVFVADQLNLPPGLTTATLTGQTNSGVSFSSQKDVLNIPDSARAFGRLKKYMGNASFYKALAKIEARNPVRRHLGLEYAGDRWLQEPRGPRHRQGQGELHARRAAGGTRGQSRSREGQGAPGRRNPADRARSTRRPRSRPASSIAWTTS